jgi:phenylalanyl-tRNA synthetase beta chain
MPKIELYQDSLFSYLGRRFDDPELERLLTAAKAELDEPVNQEGVVKIELNDTNRPDLWSTAGLARQLRLYLGGKIPAYDFFSTATTTQETGERVVTVDPALRELRSYITAFAFSGKPIDEPTLKDLIQTQEKLCWNYGRKRKSIAMGVYRADLFEYPVRYVAADPDTTRFVPLAMDRELSLRQILTEHPKGVDFGSIVADLPEFPFITDANGKVLSFPPIINSAEIGAVEVGDSTLFVELTGTDLPSLLIATSIVACDLADAGYTIQPCRIEYPYDTPMGRSLVTPYYFQEAVSVHQDYASKLLGERIEAEEAARLVRKMGVPAEVKGPHVVAQPPEYRNDFLHAVDVVEDIMIGRGMDSFEPLMPPDFTVGRLTPEERFGRRVKDIMIGLGYQEMIYNYLGSHRDFVERMNGSDDAIIRIANPMTENYEYVRNSILPCLLSSESVSANAMYPHYIFEVGKVAYRDERDNYGSTTRNFLGCLCADRQADFNLMNAHLSALAYYLAKTFELREAEDPRFIPGRTASVRLDGEPVGLFGEVHPEVLEKWGIQMPCVACELDLDVLVDSERQTSN